MQLADNGLAYCEQHGNNTGTGLFGVVARISAQGTAIIEDGEKPPIPVTIDQRQYVEVVGSQGVQIAGHNSTQTQSITDAFEKVVTAFEGAEVSEAEKKKAKSMLIGLLESKAAAAVLGPGVAYLLNFLGP